MKKLSLLIFCCLFAAFGFSQEIVVAWTFDGLTGNNNGASNTQKVIASNDLWEEGTFYADGTNGSDNFNNQASPEINCFTGTVLNDPRPTPNTSKDLALVNTTANGKSVVFKFSMSAWRDLQLSYAHKGSSTGFKTQYWSYSTDGENFTLYDSLTSTNNSDWAVGTIDFSDATEMNGADEVYIKLTVNGCTSGSGNNRLDNVVFRANINGPDIYPPKISHITIPNTSTIVINFNEPLDQTTAQTTDNYVIDNFTCTNASLSDKVVTLTFNPEIQEGVNYSLYVSNVEDLEGNVMIADTLQFIFGVEEEFHVSNLSELRAKWTAELNPDSLKKGTQIYKLTGNVLVTALNPTYRNQVFIQDETGAIVIDDENALIETPLAIGDEITEIYGTLTDYYGLLQFVVAQTYSKTAISVYNPIDSLVVTVQEMNDADYMLQHQCQLISMENVTFNETGTFSNGGKYTLSQDGTTGTGVWIHIYNVDSLTGATIPTQPVNLLGVNKVSYGSYYLIPRVQSDISTGIEDYIKQNEILVYPNPVSDNLTVSIKNDNFKVTAMAVYDNNGKLVMHKTVNDNNFEININNLAAGQYFLRLSDKNKGVTTKFIKK